jgi:hypothetical protein
MTTEDVNALHSEYKQLLSIVVKVAGEQSAHQTIANNNSKAIAEVRDSLAVLHNRLLEHMDDEEGKIEKNAVALIELADKIRELSDVIGETHQLEHHWIKLEMKKQQDRADFWKEMRISAAKWGLVGALAILSKIIFDGMVVYFKSH